MRYRSLFPLALATLGLLPLQAGLIFNRSAKPTGPETLVVGDVYDKENEAAFTPTPDHPVSYMVLGGLERDIGPSWAGEHMPEAKRIRDELTKVLAKQGFIEAKIGDPVPKLVLVFAFGTASQDKDFDDRRRMSELIGSAKIEDRLISTNESDQINEAANSDRLYIRVSAYDTEALHNKEKKLLWRTNISIDSMRNSLPDHLSLMLAEAGPYFGKDTDHPIFRDDADRKATVKMGELQIIDEPKPASKPEEKKDEKK